MKHAAEVGGIRPERLVFSGALPLSDHLARLGLADLALDTRIYNGGASRRIATAIGTQTATRRCPIARQTPKAVG